MNLTNILPTIGLSDDGKLVVMKFENREYHMDETQVYDMSIQLLTMLKYALMLKKERELNCNNNTTNKNDWDYSES